MKVEELRISNWVADAAGNYNRIAAVYLPGEIELYSDIVDWLACCTINDIFPITLTPEILINVGFSEVTGNNYYRFFDYKDFRVFIHYAENSIFATWKKCEIETTINNLSIHQLQNLVYALSGEELEFKQPITPQSAP